jgi:tripartite-type tricarboxylate transporter receptor subunit TctC
MRRRDVLWGAAGGISAALIASDRGYAAPEISQFPSRFITLVVPWGPGGPPDVIARIIASRLSEVLGQPIIVDNRPGASSSIAALDVARAVPDGYTLLHVDISLVVAPHLFSNMRVDPLVDFRPVGQSARSQFVLIVSPNLSTPTVGDFVKLAKTKSEAVTIGHSGIGTTPHLAAITFTKATGINPLLVSYRTIAQAADDVMAGQISAIFSAAAQGIGLAKGGKVQVLGVTGTARLDELPNVPTFGESGITMTGFENGSWYGIVAPAKTPNETVDKINRALRSVGEDKKVQGILAAAGAQLSLGTPEEFRTLIASQYTYWGDMLQTAGVKPQ